jgi:5-hydroxyisourate hydrolase
LILLRPCRGTGPLPALLPPNLDKRAEREQARRSAAQHLNEGRRRAVPRRPAAAAMRARRRAVSVSIRVIDCIYGRPATGIAVSFGRELEGTPADQWRDQTNDDGLIPGLANQSLPRGSYTVEFDLEGYFRTLGYSSLNSAISLRFHVGGEARHYGLTLLITPSSCHAFRED